MAKKTLKESSVGSSSASPSVNDETNPGKTRRDTLYKCARCPDGRTFDRLSQNTSRNRFASLEFHVKEAHPTFDGNFKELIGERIITERPYLFKKKRKITIKPKIDPAHADDQKSESNDDESQAGERSGCESERNASEVPNSKKGSLGGNDESGEVESEE